MKLLINNFEVKLDAYSESNLFEEKNNNKYVSKAKNSCCVGGGRLLAFELFIFVHQKNLKLLV